MVSEDIKEKSKKIILERKEYRDEKWISGLGLADGLRFKHGMVSIRKSFTKEILDELVEEGFLKKHGNSYLLEKKHRKDIYPEDEENEELYGKEELDEDEELRSAMLPYEE